MKMKEGFMLYDVGENSMIVSAEESFHGIVRINQTAKFILECMREDTTKEEIVEKMAQKYDASHSDFEKSVETVLETLRKIGALDE